MKTEIYKFLEKLPLLRKGETVWEGKKVTLDHWFKSSIQINDSQTKKELRSIRNEFIERGIDIKNYVGVERADFPEPLIDKLDKMEWKSETDPWPSSYDYHPDISFGMEWNDDLEAIAFFINDNWIFFPVSSPIRENLHKMKHIKLFENFVNESQEEDLISELEKAYGKKVKNSDIVIEDDLVRASVEFVDGFQGFYEGENEYSIGGYIGTDEDQIPEGKGTKQQEEVRNLLIDFCESNAPEED